MLGHKIWNSLSSDFQLELLANADKFKRDGEFDGVELFHHFRKHVNPSTAIGASVLKDKIETKTLAEFGHNITKYHPWIDDVKIQIDQE